MRGRGLVYLLGSGPISVAHRAALEERRHVVDALVEQTLALASENGQEKALELRNKWEQGKELRPFLDHALSRPQEKRDPAISGQWLTLSNELVVVLLGLTREMTGYPAIEDAGSEHLNNLRFSSALFRTMVGAEAGIYAVNAVSGRILALKEVNALRFMRNQSMILGKRFTVNGLLRPPAMRKPPHRKIRNILPK